MKHILRYLHRTIDLGLFYSKESTLKGYANSGYFLILTRPAHKQGMYSHVVILQFLGDQLSRL